VIFFLAMMVVQQRKRRRKEDDQREGELPVVDEAATQERIPSDLATLKDFFRFHVATGKGKNVEEMPSGSLNTFEEWFFAGSSRVTGTPIDADDRSEVFNVSILYYL
jgi:hypothetical protein